MQGIYYLKDMDRLSNSSSYDSAKKYAAYNNADRILYYLKPSLDILNMERKSLMVEFPEDTNNNISISDNIINLKYTVPQIYHSEKKYYKILYFNGRALAFGFRRPDIFIFAILLLIFIAFTIYKLIKFTSNRIFGLSINPSRPFLNQLDQCVIPGNNLVIQYSKLYNEHIEQYLSGLSVLKINYGSTLPYEYSAIRDKSKKILISNFNPDFNNLQTHIEKISAVSALAAAPGVQLIIVTDKSIEKYIETGNAKLSGEKDSDSSKLIIELIDKLDSLSKMFICMCPPLVNHDNLKLRDYLETRLENENISEESKILIMNELAVFGLEKESIEKYAEQVIKFALDNSDSENLPEKIILFIQEIAGVYYEEIWNSCTNHEKLLLDDVADNLLLNDKNIKIIDTLILKGLLKKNISIELMNQSFRNFINTKSDAYQEKIYLKVRKEGNWTKYRAPLLLLLFAIAFFIALQENVLSNIYSILTVILGILTVVTRISGIFSGGNMSKPASGGSS